MASVPRFLSCSFNALSRINCSVNLLGSFATGISGEAERVSMLHAPSFSSISGLLLLDDEEEGLELAAKVAFSRSLYSLRSGTLTCFFVEVDLVALVVGVFFMADYAQCAVIRYR